MPRGNPPRTEATVAAIEVGRVLSDRGDAAKDPNVAIAGPSEVVVQDISAAMGEPDWLLELRLRGLRRHAENPSRLPGSFAASGRPGYGPSMRRSPRAAVGAVGAGGPSGMHTGSDLARAVHERHKADLEANGVIFCDLDEAIVEHADIVRQHLATVVAPDEGGFSALNAAVFSGGTFIYVPAGVKVDVPLQTFLSVAAERRGAFERTLVVAEPDSEVQYIEGCSAPVYSADSLHVGVVELIALPGSRITYTTIQNWSRNVCSVVIKRAVAEAESHVRWVDGSIGAKFARTRPSIYLKGPKATGESMSITYAGASQVEETGARMVHLAPETASDVVAKSIAKDGGRTRYSASVHLGETAVGVSSNVRSDVLILDADSVSETVPFRHVEARGAKIDHDASVSRIGGDQIFYLMTRGLSEAEAAGLIVNGFIDPVTRTLPVEYAVEWTRLVGKQMESSVG